MMRNEQAISCSLERREYMRGFFFFMGAKRRISEVPIRSEPFCGTDDAVYMHFHVLYISGSSNI